jgi:hypothetical protein
MTLKFLWIVMPTKPVSKNTKSCSLITMLIFSLTSNVSKNILTQFCKHYNKDFSCVEGVIIPIYLLNVTDGLWVH